MAMEWRARMAAARRERLGGVWGAVVAVGALSAGVYWHWLNAVPQVTIPPPAPMPSPNGYDDLVRASREMVRAEEIDQASGSRVQGRDAHRVATDSAAPANRARLVAQNRAALADVRLALSHPFLNPPMRDFERSSFSTLAGFRRTARLLNLEGYVREDQGDGGGAVKSRLDCTEMGADEVGRGGPLIPYLVGIACEAIGRRPLWHLADRVGAADARAAARRLERIDANRCLVAEALTQEKWGGEETLLSQFRRESLFGLLGEMAKQTGADDSHRLPAPQAYLPLLWTRKATVLRNYDAAMDRAIADCARGMRGASAGPPTLPANTDPISQILNPAWSQLRFKEADSQMQTRLLSVLYALRAYRLEKGSYPLSLQALVVGGYLTRIPDDPFDPTGAPLRYRPAPGGTYLLYSVGPDGKDDNGKPIDAGEAGHRPRKTWAEAGMVGDWVVGVNNYTALPDTKPEKAP